MLAKQQRLLPRNRAFLKMELRNAEKLLSFGVDSTLILSDRLYVDIGPWARAGGFEAGAPATDGGDGRPDLTSCI